MYCNVQTLKQKKMIRNYWNEKWKQIKFDDRISTNEKFKISNYGRLINCKTENEFLVKNGSEPVSW